MSSFNFMSIDLKTKLRKEKSNQLSGKLELSRFPILKEKHYFVVDVPLDGEAPKQYIKAYLYYENCPRVNKPQSWDGYYAKFGGKSYPHESLIEYTINKIGHALGVKMNEFKLLVINGQLRFLSKDFIRTGQRLIHGIEILSEYFEDKVFIDEINKDRKNRREYLTFEEVETAITHVYSKECNQICDELVNMITFDAIIGNNDRHFYNWGVIGESRKRNKVEVIFAPIYDSARGLFWNDTQKKLEERYAQCVKVPKQINHYLEKSQPRFSFEGNPSANHFELMQFLIQHNVRYRNIIQYLCSEERENEVFNMLKEEVFPLFSKERIYLTKIALEKRFDRIRNLLND